jgi:KaiC domain protein
VSEDEEEDWFERAMREAEEESSSDSPRATADDADAEDDSDAENDSDAEAADAEADASPSDSGDDPFGGGTEPDEADDPFGGGTEPDEADDPFGGGGTADDAEAFGGDAAQSPDSDPFGGDAGSSFDEGGDPFGGDFEDGDDPFGGGGDPFGGASDPFGGGQEEGTSFDDAELDSDIDRIDVGIEGLDEMILGGIPERSLMVTIGSAGTGKTTFGLQFLTEALENDQKAVYITLEESREAILSTAEEKGWPFREWADEGKLAVVSMDPIEMANSLSSIRNDISRLIEEFGADRLVLDSVSLLEMMYDHPAKRRSEVFDFARSLKYAGVTTMLTSEASSEDAYTSRYGIIEYLVDAVFILQYVRPSDFRETRLAVEIQKIRDANHSRETKPYEITNDGISVYRQANIF